MTNPIETVPENVKVIIHTREFKKPMMSMLTRRNGCADLRWKLFNYPGKTNIAWARKDFKPDSWEPLVPTE